MDLHLDATIIRSAKSGSDWITNKLQVHKCQKMWRCCSVAHLLRSWTHRKSSQQWASSAFYVGPRSPQGPSVLHLWISSWRTCVLNDSPSFSWCRKTIATIWMQWIQSCGYSNVTRPKQLFALDRPSYPAEFLALSWWGPLRSLLS